MDRPAYTVTETRAPLRDRGTDPGPHVPTIGEGVIATDDYARDFIAVSSGRVVHRGTYGDCWEALRASSTIRY